MPNLPLTLLLHFGLLLGAVGIAGLFGRRAAPLPLFAGLGVVLFYWIVSPLGLWLQGRIPGLAGLHWNWCGKLLAVAMALAWWRIARLPRDEIGLTLRQRAGSLVPAVAGVLLACLISWTDEALLADGTNLSPERLLFQAIMPGLDEELVFRGLVFAYFARAFGGGLGLAGLAVTALFAAGHGLFVAGGAVVVNWHALLVTGLLGAIFLWLRVRTGSLLAPFAAHNLCNFGNSFF